MRQFRAKATEYSTTPCSTATERRRYCRLQSMTPVVLYLVGLPPPLDQLGEAFLDVRGRNDCERRRRALTVNV